MADKKTKTALLKEYPEAGRTRIDNNIRREGKVGRITYINSASHSALFEASFAKSAVEIEILVDQGANVNFISESLQNEILTKMPGAKPTSFKNDREFRSVTGEPCLTCSEKITLVVYLKIRHGTSLFLRKIEWKVVKESISVSMIRRRVRESLGCDNRKMLTATPEKFGEDIDVATRLAANDNEETWESDGNFEGYLESRFFIIMEV